MNQASFQQWITKNNATPGLLGLGICAPGQANLVKSCSTSFLPEALEKAWRAVNETISVLQLNRFPTARFRFIYGSAIVHCERRKDGTCLGIFAQKNPANFAPAELDRLVGEFHNI